MSKHLVMPSALLLAAIGPQFAAQTPPMPADWSLGPFVKRERPVLEPNPAATFRCPIVGKAVRWEAQNVYNPAGVVKDGKVWLLYRADDEPRQGGWGRTCRIGLAAIALLTRRGILVFYNGENRKPEGGGDRRYPAGWSGLGQALFAADEPARLLARQDQPFLHAEYDWELHGFTPPWSTC